MKYSNTGISHFATSQLVVLVARRLKGWWRVSMVANWPTCHKLFNMVYHSLRIFGRRERIRLRTKIMPSLRHMHCTLNVILLSAIKALTRMFAVDCMAFLEYESNSPRKWLLQKLLKHQLPSIPRQQQCLVQPHKELCWHNFKRYASMNKNYIIDARCGLLAKLQCNEFLNLKQLWKENPKIWFQTTQADKRLEEITLETSAS